MGRYIYSSLLAPTNGLTLTWIAKVIIVHYNIHIHNYSYIINQKLGKPTVLSLPQKNKTFHCGACPRPGLGWKSPRGVLCEGLGQGRQWMHQRGIRGCLNEPVFLFSSVQDQPMKI